MHLIRTRKIFTGKFIQKYNPDVQHFVRNLARCNEKWNKYKFSFEFIKIYSDVLMLSESASALCALIHSKR